MMSAIGGSRHRPGQCNRSMRIPGAVGGSDNNGSAHYLGPVVLKVRDQWAPIEREKLPPRPYNLLGRALEFRDDDRTYDPCRADTHCDR
jgi:hypothetical protein